MYEGLLYKLLLHFSTSLCYKNKIRFATNLVLFKATVSFHRD